MGLKLLVDKEEIARFLQQDRYLFLYLLGDLDDFFWPHTIWYGWEEEGLIQEIALLYTEPELPVLLLLGGPKRLPQRPFVAALVPFLPEKVYAHLRGEARMILDDWYQIEDHGAHLKMAWRKPGLVGEKADALVRRIGQVDLDAVAELYAVSYPGNWFQERMIESGQYYGIWEQGQLVAIAGVHVYSPRYEVAVLGNITVHPEWRRRGLGSRVTAELCRQLRKGALFVGLNVKADNRGAIRCYERLGFEIYRSYDEYLLERRE